MLLVAAFVVSGRAAAQTVVEVQGGGSSLVGGYGATANFWRNGVDGWIGLGYLDGLRAGAFLRTGHGKGHAAAGQRRAGDALPHRPLQQRLQPAGAGRQRRRRQRTHVLSRLRGGQLVQPRRALVPGDQHREADGRAVPAAPPLAHRAAHRQRPGGPTPDRGARAFSGSRCPTSRPHSSPAPAPGVRTRPPR